MAKVITIGTVKLVSSTSAGTIQDLAGNVITYSDTTLPTRSIDLDLGEYVIFAYDNPTTTSITPLTAIYAQGITDRNATNELIGTDILRQLQVYNCCASKKGAEYIDSFDSGIPSSDKLLTDAELMKSFIKAIDGFIPENETVSGRQATYLITAVSTAGTKTVSITIGTAVYSFTSATSTDATFATDIALNINNKYPGNYSYYAEASGANIIVSGSNFSTSNAVAVSGSTTNGTLTFSSSAVLASGTTAVLQGENGITNEQCQTILDKIAVLCSTPVLEIVNFEDE